MLLQRHGIVVFGIFRGKEQGDGPLSGLLRELLDLLALIVQFRRVSLFEFHPPCRIMPEPFAQGSARRDSLEPSIDSRFFFPQTARPDAVNKHAPAIGLGRVVVNAFYPNAHASKSRHMPHPAVRDYLFGSLVGPLDNATSSE